MLAALLKSYNVRLKHLSLLLGWCSLFFFFLLKAVPSEVVSTCDIIMVSSANDDNFDEL